jgi:hypothetical protein
MSRSSTLVIALSALLAVSLAGNTVLGVLLHRRSGKNLLRIKHRAWNACKKLSMQHLLFERAQERARLEQRKLVVIGNPTGGWVNKVVPVYGCGDICIDIAGCSPCGPETRVIKDDAIRALRTLPADSAVVFESETLEYVGDMTAAVAELDRITSQDPGRIYSVHSISIDVWPYHTRGIRPTPPSKKEIARRREERKKYASTGEGMARRIIFQYPPRDRYRWIEL